jgi:cytidine deaminase
MKNVEILCRLTEYDDPSQMDEKDRHLIEEAKESMKSAYAPYSHFNVGAAVLLENGKIIRGNNQENAAYPVGLCAERVAIFSAGANYPGIAVKAIAVTARSDHFHVDRPVPPCGACRQAISEYEHRFNNKIKMIMTGETGKVITSESIENLLPFQFNADDLNTK